MVTLQTAENALKNVYLGVVANQLNINNKVILIGNVGKDPDVRYLDNHVCVANLTLATTERGYTAQNGTQVPDRTEWHNLVFWRGLAETVEKYVHKGDKLYVEGNIRNRSYDDQNGVKRYVTEIFVGAGRIMRIEASDQPCFSGSSGQAPAQPNGICTEGVYSLAASRWGDHWSSK